MPDTLPESTSPPATIERLSKNRVRWQSLAKAQAAAPWLDGWCIALCMLLLSGLSWVRFVRVGTLRVDDVPDVWRDWFVGVPAVLFGAAGLFYLRAWFARPDHDLRRSLGVALAIQLAAALSLPLTSNDIFSNLAVGRLCCVGQNPYLEGPIALGEDDVYFRHVGSRWQHVLTPYGPPATFCSKLAASAGSVGLSVLIYKLVMLAASLACVLLSYRICRDRLPMAVAARGFRLLAWCPVWAWEISGQAHNDALMLLGLTVFVWAALSERPVTAALAVGLGFFTKFAIAPVLGLYLVQQGRRDWKRGLVLALVWTATGSLLFWPYWTGMASLTGPLRTVANHPGQLTNSVLAVLFRELAWRLPEAELILLHAWTNMARWATAGLGLIVIWRATSFARVCSGAVLFLLVYESIGMGWFMPWYATWLLPLAMIAVDTTRQRTVALFCALAPLLYVAEPVAFLLVPIACIPLLVRLAEQLRSLVARAAFEA